MGLLQAQNNAVLQLRAVVVHTCNLRVGNSRLVWATNQNDKAQVNLWFCDPGVGGAVAILQHPGPFSVSCFPSLTSPSLVLPLLPPSDIDLLRRTWATS